MTEVRGVFEAASCASTEEPVAVVRVAEVRVPNAASCVNMPIVKRFSEVISVFDIAKCMNTMESLCTVRE